MGSKTEVGEAGARTALRDATRGHHDRVDAAFSTARLDDRRSYGRFLLAQAAAYLPTEDALDRAGATATLSDWPKRRRGAMLRADLATLGLDVPQPVGVPAFEDDAAVLGAVYVLEGSRLGGTMLRRSVPDDLPTRFLGGGDSAMWRSLICVLDERLDSAPKRATAIGTACDIFALFEAAGRHHLKDA